jgi:serine O-acetyltransferase
MSTPDLDLQPDLEARLDFLLTSVRSVFARVSSLSELFDLDLTPLRNDAALLAEVLSRAVPPGRPQTKLNEIARDAFFQVPRIVEVARADLSAAAARNFEPGGIVSALLFYRGFHALLGHRVCHHLWNTGAVEEALAIKTLLDRSFSTDIHPAARIGAGVWLDHGLGVVIGETAIVEDDVSMWHDVTLGSTLKDGSDTRHPRVRRGAVIGAGAILLGDIEVGAGAIIAAGSVVLDDVPPGTTVAGVPAQLKVRHPGAFRGFTPAQQDEI